ncbi:hypothetical protein O3W52_01025 [Ensifer psoraleae]|uniref:Uncharacterized protein n=1 Tax=Sinorhizobium psoraleae TaxID=520838 RepID=A0ABT4K9V4_9HYPH|nr:hypothetical protein [Sinorhizobium psoraleae]
MEILPKIDFPGEDGAELTGRIRHRLVHMLAVALDLKIDAGQITALDWQRETLLEISIVFGEARRCRPSGYAASLCRAC